MVYADPGVVSPSASGEKELWRCCQVVISCWNCGHHPGGHQVYFHHHDVMYCNLLEVWWDVRTTEVIGHLFQRTEVSEVTIWWWVHLDILLKWLCSVSSLWTYEILKPVLITLVSTSVEYTAIYIVDFA